jgi:hypothetical protein
MGRGVKCADLLEWSGLCLVPTRGWKLSNCRNLTHRKQKGDVRTTPFLYSLSVHNRTESHLKCIVPDNLPFQRVRPFMLVQVLFAQPACSNLSHVGVSGWLASIISGRLCPGMIESETVKKSIFSETFSAFSHHPIR